MAAIPERLAAALADRYRLERELGAGGMATVYLALDLKHQRQVAVKVLRPDLAAALGAERFLREVGIAARLSHPHILPLHDSGEAGGFLYYVMPYVEGISLRQKLVREGELPIPEAIRILRDLADAMAFAHGQGVVHRDIKPENVMLTGRHALVMDFGVAKALAEGQRPESTRDPAAPLTSVGVALGTPAYMAPEQATGDTHVDARADLYAWGVVAYELLAGQPPFIRSTPQATLAAQATATPEPVTAHRENLPGALAALVMQCLEKRAADRPQTAEEVVTRLEAVLTPSGGMTPTATQPYQTAAMRRATRRRWLMATGVVAAAVVALGAWFTVGRFSPLTVVSNRPLVQTTELEAMAAISPDGKLVAYAAEPPGGGDFKIHLRQLPAGGAVPLTASFPGHHQNPAWSPDGSLVYFTRVDSTGTSGWVIPYVGGTPRQVIPDSARGIGHPQFTPDGQRVVYWTGGRMAVAVKLDGGATTVLYEAPQMADVVLSPDGLRLAYVTGVPSTRLAGSAIRVVALPDGHPVLVTDTVHVNRNPVWGPEGKSLLYVSNAGGTFDLYQQQLSGSGGAVGAPVRLTTGAEPGGVSLSTDGSRAVYTVRRSSAPIWMAPIDPQRESPSSALRQVTRQLLSAAYLDVSADGKWLAYDSDVGGNNDLYKVPADGGEAIQLTRDPAPDFVPRWSPDGREIVYHSLRNGNRDIRIMTADGLNDRAVTSDSTSESQPDWSPDGRAIVFHTDGGITVMTREAGGSWGGRRQLTPSYPAGPERSQKGVILACWAGDGRWILFRSAGALRLIAPSGGMARTLLAPRALGFLVGHTCSPDPRVAVVTTYDGKDEQRFWSVPIGGGAPRLLLRLNGVRLPTNTLTTDGQRLYFNRPTDEADVWVMELKR